MIYVSLFFMLTCFHLTPRNVQAAIGTNVSAVKRQKVEE